MKRYTSWLGVLGGILLGGTALRAGAGFGPSTLASALAALGGILLSLWLLADWKNVADAGSSRAAQREASGGLGLLLVLAIAVCAVALSLRHDHRWDLTQDHRLSLSEQSLKVLAELSQEVHITAYYTRSSEDRPDFLTLSQRFQELSGQISVELIDPDAQPWRAKQDDVVNDRTVIVRSGERVERSTWPDEEALLNTILQVTRSGTKTLGFVQGHGEAPLDGTDPRGYAQIAAALRGQGYAVEPVSLLDGPIAQDIAVLLVAGAQSPLLPAELQQIDQWLAAGGALFVLLEPGTDTGLQEILGDYGVTVHDDLALDAVSYSALGDPTAVLTRDLRPHEITQGMKLSALLPGARSLSLEELSPAGRISWPIALSDPQTWGETDLQGEPSFDEGVDQPGPLTLLAAVEQRVGGPAPEDDDDSAGASAPLDGDRSFARLVVSGDSDFASDAALRLFGNADLFQNAVAWLAEDLDLISVRPRPRGDHSLSATGPQAVLYLIFGVGVLPGLAALMALMLWLKRRKA